MGSIIMFRLLNDGFIFLKELENDKKIYVDGFVFLPSHIYRRNLYFPSVRKMCPIPNLPIIGENILIIFNNSKKYTLLNIILVNIWIHGKNLQDLRGQNHCNNVGLV